MRDLLKRLAHSSPDEGSHDLYCRCLDAAEEISRLRRYADAMNGKPGTERHIYRGLCPDNTQPDSRDHECPACRLLTPNVRES